MDLLTASLFILALLFRFLGNVSDMPWAPAVPSFSRYASDYRRVLRVLSDSHSHLCEATLRVGIPPEAWTPHSLHLQYGGGPVPLPRDVECHSAIVRYRFFPPLL